MILVSGFICSSFNYRSSHKKVSSKFHDPPWNSKFAVENQCLESMKGGQKTYFQRRTCCLFQISVFCSTNFELQNQLQNLQEGAGSSFLKGRWWAFGKVLGSLKDDHSTRMTPPFLMVYQMFKSCVQDGPGTINGPVIASKKVAFSLGLPGVISYIYIP